MTRHSPNARMALRAGLAGSLLMLSGCCVTCESKVEGTAFTGPEPPAANKAVLYLYRLPDEDMGGRSRYVRVDIDNIRILENLAYGGFVRREVDPGHRVISAKTSQLMLPLDANLIEKLTQEPGTVAVDLTPGSVSYVSIHAYRGMWNIPVDVKVMPENKAVVEMRDTNKLP